MRVVPWDEEEGAMEMVASILGGEATQVDPGGGAVQLHDFDLLLTDGLTIAFEVTRHNTPDSLRTAAEVTKRKWDFPQLRDTWVVDATSSFNVKALHREVAALLAELERVGISRVLLRSDMFGDRRYVRPGTAEHLAKLEAASVVSVGLRLFELGARSVYSLGAAGGEAASVIIGETSSAGSTASSMVADVAAHHANLPDNATKLAGGMDRAERHLFVWIEASRPEAAAALAFADVPGIPVLPQESPDLPQAIDAVWVAAAYRPGRVWRYHRLEGWADLGVYPGSAK